MYEAEYEVLLYEFRADLNSYLADIECARLGAWLRLIAFNEAHAARVMPIFGQDMLLKLAAQRAH